MNWLEFYKLKKYPKKLKLKGSGEITLPIRITSTGRVYYNDKNYLNIWWFEPIYNYENGERHF